MIIDGHAHVLLPTQRQLEMMDQAGVERTVLFATTIHPELASEVGELEQELGVLNEIISGKRNAVEARIKAVEEQIGVIEGNPLRFPGFLTVPLGSDQEAVLAWVDGWFKRHRFYGLGEFTLVPGQVQQLELAFRASLEFGKLPLWVHAFSPLGMDDLREINGLSLRFPEVPVILGHLGGVYWLETIKLARENQNLYLDLSAAFTTIAPMLAIRELPERTFFSSDAPYGDPWLARQMIERVVTDPRVRELVLGESAAELLGLP